MALAAYALTDLQKVREFLQKDATATTQDAILEALVNRASKAALTYTEREFAPTTTAATRVFVYRGGHRLSLAPYDLRTVTSVQFDTDGTSPTTLATTDYALRPKPAKDGVYTWLRLPGHAVYTRDGEREVTITGDWGFSAIPADVEHWVIVTVATWLRRDVSAFSTTLRLDEDRLERPEALPTAARAGLSHYKRVAAP